MIRDLDGAEPAGRSGLRWLLPAGTAACVAAFIVALATFAPAPRPGTAPGGAPLLGPAVLAAHRPPAATPRRATLELPHGSFAAETRVNLSGVTGLVAASAAEAGVQHRYRLKDGRDVALTRSRDQIAYPAGSSFTPVPLRGTSGSVVVVRGAPTALLWQEGSFHYQLSSGTLTVDELRALAETLR